MKGLDGSKKLSMYSIPGTHDSAARGHSIEWVNCQDWNIWTQLINGVRFFDMRVQLKRGQWIMVHGDYVLGFNFEHDMLNPIYRFLEQYPSECIIMRIQRDSGGSSGFNNPFTKFINTMPNRWLLQNNIPTLNQCRGKIFALRNGWAPPSGINVRKWGLDKMQDEWNLKDDWRRRRQRRRFFKKIGNAFKKAANHIARGAKKAAKAVASHTKGVANSIASIAKITSLVLKSDFVKHVGLSVGSDVMKHVVKHFVVIVDKTQDGLKAVKLVNGKDAASKKLTHILAFHYGFVVKDFDSKLLHLNHWSYFSYSRMKVPTFPRDNAKVMRKMNIIPELEGSNLGICVFDFPTKSQLEQVFCRNYGSQNGNCFK